MSQTDRPLFTVAQAGEAMGVTPRTVLRWIDSGKISATKMGPGTTGYVIARSEIERLQDEAASA